MKVGDLVTHNPHWLSTQYTGFTDAELLSFFDVGIIVECRNDSDTGRSFVRVLTADDDVSNDMWFVAQELELLNEKKQNKKS
tara:strand:- start:816 stop:1061 length:246 start_codon:yes stop_codon:yes gene_type:complete